MGCITLMYAETMRLGGIRASDDAPSWHSRDRDTQNAFLARGRTTRVERG